MTAQSGTGKTATFSISILQTINTTQRETQALILSPTRELATQIQSVILALGEYLNVHLSHTCLTLDPMSRLYWRNQRW
jgi:ATP-dependent RNA helicase